MAPKPIASTQFIGERPSGERFQIEFHLYAPQPQAGNEWRCAVELNGLHERLAPVIGEDPIQSLCLALGLANVLLQAFVKDGGRLRFKDPSMSEVPLEAYFGPFRADITPPAA